MAHSIHLISSHPGNEEEFVILTYIYESIVIFWSKCSRFLSVFGSDMLHCYICYTCYTLLFQQYC